MFGGNARCAKQSVFGWYEGVPSLLRRGLLESVLVGTPIGRLPLARKGRSYIEQAKVPLPGRMPQYNLLLHLGPGEIFTPECLARTDAAQPLRQQREVWQQAQGAGAHNRVLAYDWRYTLAEADLPKVRGATSLAGRGIVQGSFARQLVDELLPQHPGYYGDMVWILMMLEQWLRSSHGELP